MADLSCHLDCTYSLKGKMSSCATDSFDQVIDWHLGETP